MPGKRARQDAILDLVRRGRIDSQQQLAGELAGRGLEVSQSTLSRDIRELGLVKAGNAYAVREGAPRHNAEQTLRLALREFLVDLDSVDLDSLPRQEGFAGIDLDAMETTSSTVTAQLGCRDVQISVTTDKGTENETTQACQKPDGVWELG